MEPEKLAKVINSYLSEMTTIAVKSGGTIDKFIGDAIMVFFGDPETEGEAQDALKCVEMAIMMKNRVEELQKHWKKMGYSQGSLSFEMTKNTERAMLDYAEKHYNERYFLL